MINEPIPNQKIPELDLETLRNTLEKRCLQIYFYIKGLSESQKIIAGSDLLRIARVFTDTYIVTDNDEVHINHSGIDNLMKFLIQNFTIISEDELLRIAEKALETEKDKLYFYIPAEKNKKSDFTSPQSHSSNEYMLKLVSKQSARKDIQIKIIDEDHIPEDIDELTMVDDAAYSGNQLETVLNELFEKLKRFKHIKMKVFLAASTDTAIERISQMALRFSNIELIIIKNRQIHTLFDITLEHPQFQSFFSAEVIANYAMGMIPDRSIKKEILDYLTSKTLTRIIHKQPDFFSFPRDIAMVYKDDPNINKYPLVE